MCYCKIKYIQCWYSVAIPSTTLTKIEIEHHPHVLAVTYQAIWMNMRYKRNEFAHKRPAHAGCYLAVNVCMTAYVAPLHLPDMWQHNRMQRWQLAVEVWWKFMCVEICLHTGTAYSKCNAILMVSFESRLCLFDFLYVNTKSSKLQSFSLCDQ